MSYILATQEWWDPVRETGEWALFREGVHCPKCHSTGTLVVPDGPFPPCDHPGCAGPGRYSPPAEFVEWAKPCETCGGAGYIETHDGNDYCPNPDCLGGKRRIAVAVPCEQPLAGLIRVSHAMTGQDHAYECCDNGLVTVGHVVVEWGPLVVVGTDRLRWKGEHDLPDECIVVYPSGQAWRWIKGRTERLTLPPDIDPATLVGQYAIGGKVVTPCDE